MRTRLSMILGMTLLAGPAAADPLSLNDAVRAALARSPALVAAARAADGADARTAQAETAWLPRLSVDSRYTFSGPLAELVIDTGITPPGSPSPLVVRRTVGSEHRFSTTLGVGWRAVDFGARDVLAEAGEAAARAARLDGEARAAELAFGVRAAYHAARMLDGVATITDRSLASTLADQDVAKAQLAAGIGNAVAVAGLEARVAELEARRTAALIGRDRALDTLRLLVGLPASPLELTDDLPTTDLQATAEGTPPSVARIMALEEAAEKSHEAIGRGYWPTVDVFGAFGVQYPETAFADSGWDMQYQVGVALNWPIFDGMMRSRQRDEAAARVAELRAVEQAAREEADRAGIDADARLTTARANAAAAARAEQTAQVYAKAARAAVTAGVGTELEVRQAEAALDGARIAALQARFEAAMARADALRARGQVGVAEEVAP